MTEQDKQQLPGQLTFPDVADVEHHIGDSLRQRFDTFHAANPWVADHLERLAAEAVRDGATRLGIGALYEVLRWQHRRATRGDTFRLNNNHRAFYARLLIDRHPEWERLFETRRQREAA